MQSGSQEDQLGVSANRFVRTFRPFPSSAGRTFSGAYLTVIAESVEPTEKFYPTIHLIINDIVDAAGQRLNVSIPWVGVAFQIVAQVLGVSLCRWATAKDGKSLSFWFEKPSNIGIDSWAKLSEALDPSDPEDESRLERLFYLNPAVA